MQQLAARLARGETAAFTELYDGCANQLHHYLVVCLRSRDAADEVLQETFLRLARFHGRFNRVENPVAYAFAVARNEAFRKRKRMARDRGGWSAAELFEVMAHDDRPALEAAAVVAEALDRVNEQQREIIELRFYAGLTFREIAEVTGAPQGTVVTRYRAALERLRGFLAKDWS